MEVTTRLKSRLQPWKCPQKDTRSIGTDEDSSDQDKMSEARQIFESETRWETDEKKGYLGETMAGGTQLLLCSQVGWSRVALPGSTQDGCAGIMVWLLSV
jgi:hypothetical protein